jgi:MOSC domain-containing protein YiiM
MATVVSVNVGVPDDVEWQGKTVRTAIWKRPVTGRVLAGRLNLAGDAQADLSGHGGEQRAIMVYQLDPYRYWEKPLGRSDFVPGMFGENLTVDGLADTEVCIGDRFRIGSGIFEVSQPPVTCYRVGLRLNHPEMPALLVSHRRPGFYLRVIQEGPDTGEGGREPPPGGGARAAGRHQPHH